MKATDHLLLPKDLIIAPAGAFAPALRARLGAGENDRILTRPRSRARSLVVDAKAADFLEIFRMPTTVVEAVMRHAAATGEDPEMLLETAAPLLLRLRQQRYIAVKGDEDVTTIEPTLGPGVSVVAVNILRCVHLFEDVEVYRACHLSGENVALKILRPEPSLSSRQMLEREAAILTYLEGRTAPRLIESGVFNGRPYLVQSWCDGISAVHAAGVRRRGLRLPTARDLLMLCAAIIQAYANLHACGVVHGDVHPGNVRVAPDGTVKLLDFGLSHCDRAKSHLPPPRRGGLPDYFEPEYCAALLRHEVVPPATPQSDQYALGSLLYLLLTSSTCQDFSLESGAWLRQVAEGKPLPFAARGLMPWPELEAVLARSLDVDPSRRFPTMDEFLAAFERVIHAQLSGTMAEARGVELLTSVVHRFAPAEAPLDDAMLERIRAPHCSLYYGAAGIAWFLYRLAGLRSDPRLLAAADLWCVKARQNASDPGAFSSAAIGITPEVIGTVSPFHNESGLHLVQALIAHAMGDFSMAGHAARAFAITCAPSGQNPDLTIGWSSVILGCASLAEALPPIAGVDRQPFLDLGHRLSCALENWIAERRIVDARDMDWLGLAHGWAGLLFGLLRWTQATGARFPAIARERLYDLAALGRIEGAQISWPIRLGDKLRDRVAFTGWCHGSAGYLLLWTLAHQLLGEQRFLELARGAAHHIVACYGTERNVNASLCCGYAGQAYGLLALHRQTGETELLNHARELCARAAELALDTSRPDSLYKGDTGIALLVEELEQPALASMPLVEAEGWA